MSFQIIHLVQIMNSWQPSVDRSIVQLLQPASFSDAVIAVLPRSMIMRSPANKKFESISSRSSKSDPIHLKSVQPKRNHPEERCRGLSKCCARQICGGCVRRPS